MQEEMPKVSSFRQGRVAPYPADHSGATRKLLSAFILGLLVLAFLGVNAWQGFFKPKPIVSRKPLIFWLENYSSGYVLERALKNAGTNAIPTLLRLLRRQDSPFKIKLMALSEAQPLVPIHYWPSSHQNSAAFFSFQILGGAAKSAVPDLIEIYRQGISESSRAWTARSLGAIGPAAKQAIPLLLQGATNSSAMVRWGSVLALGDIHSQASTVMPVLTTALNDQNVRVRVSACTSLARFGAEAKGALPALSGLLNHSDRNVRTAASSAIESINQASSNNPSQVEADAATRSSLK
jgi:HEAT repeat protein